MSCLDRFTLPSGDFRLYLSNVPHNLLDNVLLHSSRDLVVGRNERLVYHVLDIPLDHGSDSRRESLSNVI